MAHYLDAEIAALSDKCDSITAEEKGARMYRGAWGAARVVGRRVYFFEAAKAIQHMDMKTAREAKLAALEWVIKGLF